MSFFKHDNREIEAREKALNAIPRGLELPVGFLPGRRGRRDAARFSRMARPAEVGCLGLVCVGFSVGVLATSTVGLRFSPRKPHRIAPASRTERDGRAKRPW
jgi:hypothetical protein